MKIKIALYSLLFLSVVNLVSAQDTDLGFETLQLHRIEAGCAVGNIGSMTVLEKVGMFREAHTRKLLPLKSGWSDNYRYAILSTDLRK